MNNEEKRLRYHFRQMQGMARITAIAVMAVSAGFSMHAVPARTRPISSRADARMILSDSGLTANVGAVFTFMSKAFDTTEFQSRWQSETWSAPHAWLHIASELGISVAYLFMAAI